MITDILFDMGGVLIDFNPVRFTEIFASAEQDRELLLKSVYYSPFWRMMDTGELNCEQAVERMCSAVPERLHSAVYDMVCRWPEVVNPIPGMPELVKELKDNGYRLSLLTNAQISHQKYWDTLEYYPQLFEGRIMLSSRWRVVKPYEEFYLKAADVLKLNLSQCMFVDDLQENVDGAVKTGANGIRFTNPDELRKELVKRGIRVHS